MDKQLQDSLLFGSNAPFIEAIYEEYLHNPISVDPAWREYFDKIHQTQDFPISQLAKSATIKKEAETPKEKKDVKPSEGILVLPEVIQTATNDRKQVAVLQLINMYRYLGLSQASLDPLQLEPKPYRTELDPANFGFTENDMDTVYNTGSLAGPDRAPLRKILQILKETYCGSIGAEYMYISSVEQKRWLQSKLEINRSNPNYSDEYKKHILERLSAAEGLEKYLHTRYIGQKRFSGEGNESLIPLLDCLLEGAGKSGV